MFDRKYIGQQDTAEYMTLRCGVRYVTRCSQKSAGGWILLQRLRRRAADTNGIYNHAGQKACRYYCES